MVSPVAPLVDEPQRQEMVAELSLPVVWTSIFLACWLTTIVLTGFMIHEMHQLNNHLARLLNTEQLLIVEPSD